MARLLPHLGRLARANRWRRLRDRPRVWAHRGASALEPENTMRAFERGLADGADGLELDVRFDADHNVVVFHDDTLDRLCGQSGRMDACSATARAELRVRGEPVPLLAEVLATFDTELDIEIKAPHPGRMGALVTAVAKVIRDAGRRDQLLVSSFDPVALVQFHRELPDLALAHIFASDQPFALRRGLVARAIGAALVHPEHTLCTEASVKRWHTAGLPINAFTVDDPAELRRLDRLGLDGVFSNDPAHTLRVFAAIS